MSEVHYSSTWKKVRREILDRDGHTCQIRGRECTVEARHVDHIVPVHLGGSWYDHGNLRASCANCNLKRTYKERRPTKASRAW